MNHEMQDGKRIYHVFFSSFNDIDLENEFLDHNLNYIKRIIMIVLFFFAFNNLFLMMIHAFSDNAKYAGVNSIFIARTLTLGFSIFIITQLKKITDHDILEKIIFSYLLFISVSNGIVHLEFPDPEEITYAIEIMIILAIYLVFPINLKLQLIGAIAFSVSNFTSLSLETHSLKLFSHTVVMMLNVNFVGFVIARYYQRVARKLFLAYQRESRLKDKYEKSMLRLKHVSGLVPICKSCKSVQNVDGIWDRFEEYISDNSDLRLTHSICPECNDKYMAEIRSHRD